MIEPRGLSKEAIAHRAYELCVQRGAKPGNEVDDWVKAEKELCGEVVVAPTKAKSAATIRS